MRVGLTVGGLRQKWAGKDWWESDGGHRGSGRLLARFTITGPWFYFGYKHQGKTRRLPLGPYDPAGAKGLTLQQARDRSLELSRVYRTGDTDIHGYVRHELHQRTGARKAAEEAAARELQLQRQGSLGRLLDEYVAHLRAQGRPSARDVPYTFKHVPDELLERRASQLEKTDFMPCINALVTAGKGRMGMKLRTFLAAAYGVAIAAQDDPAMPQVLRDFGIKYNPVASISTKFLQKYNRRGTRYLSEDELAAYMRGLEGITDYLSDALTVALYLGGQRAEQLLRVTWADVDIERRTVLLRDGKGMRDAPRLHLLPLTPVPLAIVQRRSSLARYDPRVFATAVGGTLSQRVTGISRDMVKAAAATGVTARPFSMRDIRRTCETLLGRKPLSVPKHIRAQILSHGLGGVQDRHYDMNEYMDEKTEALEAWGAYLDALRARPVKGGGQGSSPDSSTEGAPGA